MKKEAQRMTKAVFRLTIDQEEEYLNRMCEQGWKPIRILLGLWFTFERCQPGEYIVRVTTGIDTKGRKASRQRYERMTEILTDSGAEIVPEINLDAKTRIYAVRPAHLGDFEINTDIDALIADYTARRKYHMVWAVIALVVLAAMISEDIWITDTFHFIRWEEADLTDICLSLICYASLLFAFATMILPVPAYTRQIRELKEKRQFEE